MANTKPTLLDGLLKKRLAFHGHLVGKGGITFDLMIGRIHGTRPRGRPRTTWLKDLATQANISYREAIAIPRDKNKWRSVGNPRRTPDDWVNEWVSEYGMDASHKGVYEKYAREVYQPVVLLASCCLLSVTSSVVSRTCWSLGSATSSTTAEDPWWQRQHEVTFWEKQD